MIDAPAILHTEPLGYACVRRTVPVSEIQTVMEPGIRTVLAALAAQGRKPVGPWFTHHFQRPVQQFDFEICFPVDARVEPDGEVYSAVWPAMTVARTQFHGNYSGLPAAWGELEQWIHANGHTGRTEVWERYLIHPNTEPDPSGWITELNWPLAE